MTRKGARNGSASLAALGGNPFCRSRLRTQAVRSGMTESLVLAGDLFNEIDDPATELGLLDPRERLSERQALGGREEVRHVGGRWCFFHTIHAGVQRGGAFEEECNRDLQNMGNLLQSAGADPVRALLVFLDLLERQAERIPQLFLAHR